MPGSRFKSSYSFIVPFIFGCILVIVSCDESLPSRNNPKVIFKGDVSFSYIYSINENDFRFYVDVTNVYDETIQDTAKVSGTLEIVLKRDSRYHKTVYLSIVNLVSTLLYDSIANCFTLDPAKKMTFLSLWNLIDDNQIDLSTSIFQYQTDPSCPYRLKSQTETFILKGSIQIINGGGEILFGPKEINVFYVTPSYIVDKNCPPYPR